MDAVWGDDAIDRSRNTLQVYVSNLRRLLEPAASSAGSIIATAPPGYALNAPAESIDLRCFTDGCATGERLLAGRPEEAAAAFSAALALCRGRLCDDLIEHEALTAERLRVEELRVRALEGRIEADLACGRHTAVIPELEQLVHEYPLRERLWAHLMLALYRSSRQADALRAFQRARAALADEAGLDPGPSLMRLERSIVAQSPRLTANDPDAPRLVCFDASGSIREFRLHADAGRVTVGRRSDAAIPLVWDDQVSRDHAELMWSGGSWQIVDDGRSTNGSYLNGERIEGTRALSSGDRLRLGSTVLVLVADTPAAPSPASPDDTTVLGSALP
jgi:DNA-binding SARP family transcriptional activator